MYCTYRLKCIFSQRHKLQSRNLTNKILNAGFGLAVRLTINNINVSMFLKTKVLFTEMYVGF